MQISETLSQELHKQFTVTFPVSELEGRVNARLEEMKPRVNLKGFRPGKAPVSFLKKQFGKSIMGEVVEAAVNEGSQKAISDNKLKPALQPRVEPVGSVEDVVDGKSDLTFKVIVDLMPEFDVTDVAKLSVERLTADVADADIDEALSRLAQNARDYASKDDPAAKDDVVVIDYEGSIDGTPFDGGKGEDFNLTLGSGTFIPGFEDGLIGAQQERLNQVKLELNSQRIVADLTLRNSLEIAKESPVFYQSANFAFRSLLTRYNSGLTNYADLIQAQYGLVKAETDLKKSYFDCWKALLYEAAVQGDLSVFLNQVR